MKKNSVAELRRKLKPRVAAHDLPALDMQNTQGWLCEFDKYERVRLGEGHTKQKFDGQGRLFK